MLGMIKNMIKEKTSFLEAASVIFEDVSGMNLDDRIVLGESEEQRVDEPTEDLEDNNNSNVGNEEIPQNNPSEEPRKEDDLLGSDVDDNQPPESEPVNDLLDDQIPETNPRSDSETSNNEGNSSPEDPQLDIPGSDLPNPVGAQTGEPINPDNDILNVEIDLGSNTMKDILPVPPTGATEVVPTGDDETPSQHVDSGFGNINESTKDDNIKSTLTIYGVDFKIPDKIDGFIDSYNKSKLTDDISATARKAMISMITPSNIKKIEKSILDAEKEIGEEDDTDDIRIERIKKYLSKAEVGKFLCTNSGKVSMIKINMKHIDGVLNAWEEHEMWITSKGEVITYDGVNLYKESYNEYSYVESYFRSIGLGNTAYQEAITLGDESTDNKGEEPIEDTPKEDPKEDPQEKNTSAEEPKEDESPVTSAVKDKVSDLEDSDTFGSEEEVGGSEAKLDILKKLGNITKNIEDAKKAVMNSIQ